MARTIDVDAKHMQQVLKRAHEHKGTAFVEILQNCPVFNDGIWDELQDRKTRAEASLVLEHGQPLVFGGPGERKGIVFNDGIPSVISLADEEDPIARGVVVHDEKAPAASYAGVLATLQRPEFPMPVGVLRAVDKATYEDELQKQIDSAIAERGKGDLKELLHSGDTWTI